MPELSPNDFHCMIVFLIPVNLLRERGFVLHRNTAAHKSHCKQKDILFFSFLILLIILYCVGISLMRDYGECIYHGRESHAMPLRRFHEESADNAEAAALFIGNIVPHF